MDRKEEVILREKLREGAVRGIYRPDWSSLAEHEAPRWFGKLKFGVFIHWGLYSIPAHGNEWYSRNMYIQDKEEWHWHRKHYGPQDQFGYRKFIPQFQAEKFSAQEWVKQIKRAGARYIFPVAEHHDGFQLYKSRLSRWNSWEMGPKRDILAEWKSAAEEEGLIFCTSSHRAEHWFFMGHGREFASDVREPMKRGDFYWPAQKEPDHQALESEPWPSEEFVEDWLLRTAELIDDYQPSLLYFDWWVQHRAFKEGLKEIAAYYYNRALEWGKEVSVCYKHDAMMFGSGIPEVERGGMAEVMPFVWQTDTAAAKNSWCYTDSLEYKTVNQIICSLIQAVCKNGNLLLNVGPKGDGSIPDGDREILEGIGRWMEVNGEGIYGSRPWKAWGEGPVKEQGGQFTDREEIAYTGEDIRFTAKGDCIYAFFLHYPKDGNALIRTLAEAEYPDCAVFHGLVREVRVLGAKEQPRWYRDFSGLHLQGGTIDSRLPVTVRIRIM